MHVALNGYFWDQPRTGSGQYLRHLWSALSELPPLRDHRFTMLMPPARSHEDPVPASPTFQIAHAKPPPFISGKNHNLDKVIWEQQGITTEAKRHKATLIHAPYLSAPIRKSCPTVVTAHDMIPWIVPGYKGSLPVQLYLSLAAASARRANLIIADSHASRRDVINVLKVSPRKVHTVYLGIEPAPAYTSDQLEHVRARFGLPPRFAFYIGGFDRRKSVPLLLQSWRRVLDAMPQWCGDGKPVLAIGGAVPDPGGIFPDVRGVASALGLIGGMETSVRFLGRISESDKPLLMTAAHLFIYPSAYEGFGFDPLEALSVGCPVVSSSGGSLKEVVGDAGLLVPPGDEAELAGAILGLWDDESQRNYLSERGRARAKLFTWQRTAEQTLHLYSVVKRARKK